MKIATATRLIRKFDPKSRIKCTPGERRQLAAAGFAYEVPGESGVFVLTEEGRAILHAHYRQNG